jgi:hypothetical protein
MEKELLVISRRLRSRIVNDNPGASSAEIDAKVRMVMAAGLKPTTDKIIQSVDFKIVEDVRRKLRRAEVKKRRSQRRS